MVGRRLRQFDGRLLSHLSRIHFIDLAVQSAAADAEFFRGGGDVSLCRGKRLADQALLGRVQIERARPFLESIGSARPAQAGNACRTATGRSRKLNFRPARHDHPVLDRRSQLAHISRPIVGEQGIHRVRP